MTFTFNRPHSLHHSSLSTSAAVSLSLCVLERVITAKLHRRHRLSPRKEKYKDGEIFVESWKGGRPRNRRGVHVASWERAREREKKEALLLICLYFHISAVRQQLLSSSAAVNRFPVSDVRLCLIIAPAKSIQATLMRISNHSERRHFICSILSAGRLSPTCQSVSVNPPCQPCSPPPVFSPHPALLCSVTLTPCLRPSTQSNVTTRQL